MKEHTTTCYRASLWVLCLAATSANGASLFTRMLENVGLNTASNLVQTAAEKVEGRLLRILGDDTNAFTSGNLLISKGGGWQPATNAADLQEAVKRQYVVRTAATETRTLSAGTVVLPEKVVVPRKSRSESLTANLALLVQESPLPWQSNAYRTVIQVGLQAEGLKKAVVLDSPIHLRLVGSNVVVEPAVLTIRQLGVSGYASAMVSAPHHDEGGEVTILSDLGQRSFAIPVRANPAGFKIAASDNRVLGYGLGTVRLTVWRLAEDQRLLADTLPVTLNLHVDQGKVSPTTITIPVGASSTTAELRSAGLGRIRISAESGSATGTLDGVTFTFPAAFVVAGLVGGCLGGTTRLLRHRARNRKSSPRFVWEGCVVGLLGVGAATVGMVASGLPASVLETELGAFMIASVGGYAGAPWFDRLARLTGKTPPALTRQHLPA